MYLIYGESFRLIEDEINQLIQDIPNIITIDLSMETLDNVFLEANYVSLFNDKKCIIVKNADFFATGKENEKTADLFLENMEKKPETCTLIFTTYHKIDARKKVTKLFKEKYKIISVFNLTYDDLYGKALEYVKKNKFKISSSTLQYILACCKNNYDLIYNELNKIFLYYVEPQEIKEEDVKEIVSHSIIDNNFKFVEAVVDKKIKTSLNILDDLYALKVDPIVLIMLLSREYRLIFSTNILLRDGYRNNAIAKKLNLQEWQVEKILRTSNRYTNDTLKSYLKKLAQIDYQIKSGQMDKYLGLKLFLLEVLDE